MSKKESLMNELATANTQAKRWELVNLATSDEEKEVILRAIFEKAEKRAEYQKIYHSAPTGSSIEQDSFDCFAEGR